MSCINLRLPPANKAWKSFTSGLQGKLSKFNRSKAIKKPSKHHSRPKKLHLHRMVFNHGNDRKRRKGSPPPTHGHALKSSSSSSSFRFHLNKIAAPPVYIDTLFPEPITVGAISAACPLKGKNSSNLGSQERSTVPETSKQGDEEKGPSPEDDMWESLGFASPQMHGIDEKAEKFIFSFRAEMELEEIMAHRL